MGGRDAGLKVVRVDALEGDLRPQRLAGLRHLLGQHLVRGRRGPGHEPAVAQGLPSQSPGKLAISHSPVCLCSAILIRLFRTASRHWYIDFVWRCSGLDDWLWFV